MIARWPDDTESPSLPALLGQCGRVALFLDFDGVLVETAPTPDSVAVAPETIARLQTLNSALEGALAIVSGRDIGGLDALLAPLRLAVAGDHGNARRGADGEITLLNEPAAAAAAALHRELTARFGADPRIIVERKSTAVAVHYRLAPDRADDCIAAVTEAAAKVPELSVLMGSMVVEARAAGADKGVAVRGFMGEPPFASRTPIFIGDDRTDEDGFRAAQELGGLGIKVGAGGTAARYRIAKTGDVPALLEAIVSGQRRIK